ncbi:MAG: GNAT family N-acetyltransferase [Streptococcaceae bacterium]|jgi:GNAT superfamily N-acetyltransferase|nr:GNAT family N-acetyltransferase [Streptococcaceae bacterium]
MREVKRISDELMIAELESEVDFAHSWPVVQELRASLSEREFLKFVQDIPGYRAFVALKCDKIVSYAGFAAQVNMYEGHHLFVYELVTAEHQRLQGFGKLLLGEVEVEARRTRQEMLVLTSGLARVDAHRFYEEKMGMEKKSFVFRKELK